MNKKSIDETHLFPWPAEVTIHKRVRRSRALSYPHFSKADFFSSFGNVIENSSEECNLDGRLKMSLISKKVSYCLHATTDLNVHKWLSLSIECFPSNSFPKLPLNG